MAHSLRGIQLHPVRRWIAVVSVAGTSLLSPHVRAAVDPAKVDETVAKAVEYLKKQQKADGSWETTERPKTVPNGYSEAMRWGGETAIATYALCAADEVNSPEVKKAIEFLLPEDLHGTYAVGLRSQVYPLLPEAQQTRAMKLTRDRDRDFVLYSRIQHGPRLGFYSYAYDGESTRRRPLDKRGPLEGAGYDRSNSQYGVLGAWALDQAGAEIPITYWKEEDEAWKKAQLIDGGWDYAPGAEEKATMTAAGIATLFITQDYMLRETGKFEALKGGVTNENIEKGMAWMDRHIGELLSGAGGNYGLYGVERIGVASGRRNFGSVDWYQTGAELLMKSQRPDGSYGTIHDTCFAVLFLVRGRAPVMMNKLQYANEGGKQTDPWNERPRDTANLARWMGKHSVESFYNWQIVNLKSPVDELHDAPILYMSGSEELVLSNQEIDKLRLFCEQGGMILGNADGGNKNFATSFEKLGIKMFPNYKFRLLPRNHPIYSEQYLATKWRTHPIVQAMDNGVRELMILLPDFDPARAWQAEATKNKEEAFQLAGNIFLYATGRENLEHKGATYIVHPIGNPTKKIEVARLEVGDNWDPEPGAWRREAAVIQNQEKVGVEVDPVKLTAGALKPFRFAHLTGTTRFTLTPEQRAELKNFCTYGGTLIVDAAGGSTEFAESAEAELKQTFGEDAVKGLEQPLPPDHLAFGDFKKEELKTYRAFCRGKLTGSLRDPRICGITLGGSPRVAIFFSREDLTGAMVGEPMDGILGYAPKAAAQLVLEMVMYGDRGGKPRPLPATKPTTIPVIAKPGAPKVPTKAPATRPATQPMASDTK